MWTDGELRQELSKFGVSVGPITKTTRALYVKRLEKLQKENGSKLQSSSRIEVKKFVGKAVTMPPKKRSSSPVLRSRLRRSLVGYSTDESEDDGSDKISTLDKAPITRVTRRSMIATKDIEVKPRTPVHRRVEALTTPRRSSSDNRSGSSQNHDRYSDDDSSDASDSSSYVDLCTEETNTSPSLVLNVSNAGSPSFRRIREDDNDAKNKIKTWDRAEKENIGNNFTLQRRLLHAKGAKVSCEIDHQEKTPTKKGVGNGNLGVRLRKSQDSDKQSMVANASSDHDLEGVKIQPWTLNFSSFLPIGTCIFFIVLGLLYVTMKYDTSLNSPGFLLSYDIQKDPADIYLQIAHQVYDRVGMYTGEVICGTSQSPDEYISVLQVAKELQLEDESKKQAYGTALEEFIKNPDWGIALYDQDRVKVEEALRFTEAKYIGSEQPILSGWCRFTRAVKKVLFRIFLTTAAGILIWLGLVYRRYRTEKQREERELMYTMVQKILDALRKQYDMSENNDNVQAFLPILHVRDMILPPQDRKKMERVWERAKHFLSASESRIRVENQRIQGEDYLVWRWIQAASPTKRHSPTSRVWQGSAFDISKSNNRPMISPTPCLKIRNVFESDMEINQNWVQQIQDSILEKCQGNNGILRICVVKESKEGLVYILCASNEAAGRAFESLHGAWFDGRLVTVKFIRLSRFHYRFPDSVNQATVPMRPASSLPVSTIMSSTPGSNETPSYQKLYPSLSDD